MFSFNFYKALYKGSSDKTFGDRLKNERLKKGLSQYDLSNLINITRAAISEYELNNIIPTKETILKIGLVLNIDYICSEGYSKLIISNFNKKLKLWRLKNNLSITKASTFFDTDKSTYYKWENGIFNMSKDKYYQNKNLIDSILDL